MTELFVTEYCKKKPNKIQTDPKEKIQVKHFSKK